MPYEIKACAGKPYRPSNATEGMMFREQFCDRCKLDDPFAGDGGCDILMRSLFFLVGEDGYPAEWVHDDRGRPKCAAFCRREGGGDA